VASWEDHPLPRFLERGLTVTLSTDDPSISGIDLAHEYRAVQDHLGLTEADCHTLQKNALEAAFLTEGERRALRSLAATET
jgi:adenosine deaminase